MRLVVLASLCALSLAPRLLHADAVGGTYELRRAGMTSGGGRSSGQAWELHGTFFRHDASAAMTGGVYRLTGGLLVEAAPALDGNALFRNGFE